MEFIAIGIGANCIYPIIGNAEWLEVEQTSTKSY
jgi:23S rRNA A1618 N6-methylase RlmF